MADSPFFKELPKATRAPANPILEPRTDDAHWWERNGLFNAGVTEYKEQIILLYRAYDTFRISRLGLAHSKDGIHFTRYDHPAIDTDPQDPDERLGIEDPRVTKIDDTYYIVHTVASYHAIGAVSDISGVMDYVPWRVRIAMHSTKDFKKYIHHDVILPDLPAKNGCLLPEKVDGAFALYYRQHQEFKLSFTRDFQTWYGTQTIAWPAPRPWQEAKFGLGAPPLITAAGNLMVYHAVDKEGVYRIGLMMFDRKDPAHLLWYSGPILEPEMSYEKSGFIPNVVYACGAIIRNDELWIYYGAADRVIGRAILPLEAVLKP